MTRAIQSVLAVAFAIAVATFVPPIASAVPFTSCAEARGAGAAPLYAGEPGYSRKLDRDGDGVACETGVAASEPPSAAAPAPVAAPQTVDRTTYVIGRCWNGGEPLEERPATVSWGCDGTGTLKNMTWTSWGPDGAEGSGTSSDEDCEPSCAASVAKDYPVIVRASVPKAPAIAGCPANVLFYTDLTIGYTQALGPWVSPSSSDYVEMNGVPAKHMVNDNPQSCT